MKNRLQIFQAAFDRLLVAFTFLICYLIIIQSQHRANINNIMIESQTAYLAAVNAMQRLIAKAKDQKSTSQKSCIVALYTADDEIPLRFSGKIGMLQMDFDRDFKLHFLRFYDIQSLQLLFEVQLFYGFGDNYRKTQKDTLYIFDLFADGIIGFQFRNKQQGDIFALKVKSVSPKNQQFRQLMKDRIQKQIEAKKQSSFFGKIKKKFNTLIHEEQHHQESIVLKVEKKKSISLNQAGQFDLDNAPPEWEDFLMRAGVKKEDLKDKQVMKLLLEETIVHQAKKQAEQNPDLDKRHLDLIKQQQQEQIKTQCSSNPYSSVETGSILNLPPPPPPIPALNLPMPSLPPAPTLNLAPPPPLEKPNRTTTNRADLMAEIRNNNLKLKPVKVTDKGMQLDLSSMNKQQRHDLAQHIRMKLQLRKQALNRRKASDASDQDD